MKDLRISHRLYAAAGLVAVLALVIGLVGIVSIRAVDREDTLLYEHHAAITSDLATVAMTLDSVRYQLLASASEKEAVHIQDHINKAEALLAQTEEAGRSLEARIKDVPEMMAAWSEWKTARSQWQPVRNRVLGYLKAGQTEAARLTLLSKDPGIRQAIESLKSASTNLLHTSEKSAKAAAEANTATTNRAVSLMITVLVVCLVGCIAGAFLVSRSISAPLAELTHVSDKIALGDVDVQIRTAEGRSEIGQLAASFRRMMDGTREAVLAAQKISAGNLAVSLQPRSDKDVLAHAIVQIKNTLEALVADARMLSQAAVDGRLETRADATKHQGDFRKIVEGVNATLDAVIGPLNVAANYVDRISRGDIPHPITDNYNGEFNTIKNNLNTCIQAVNLLIQDANMLSKAAVEGRLATRADASRHQGDFRKIVEGVNATLDAVIGPLNVAADYVDRISRGDIPQPITDSYNGDFNTIKNNLNTCIRAVNLLIEDARLLSKAAVEGRLNTRADASRHQGDFRKIVEGVNDTLDAVIGPLNVAADYVDRISRGDIPQPITDSYNGDFNTIKNNLNTCIQAVNLLIQDANMLSQAAVEGRLATRADAKRHQGDFRKIVEGVNATLDAVIGPLNVAATYVDRISKGDIPQPITDSYNGDFNTIKNNLNICIQAVNLLVQDANRLAEAGVRGQLETRADASKHQGDFRKIVEGVNATLDAVVQPIQELQAVLERVAARDLTARVQGSYQGDFDAIKTATNRAIENLDEGLQQVAIGADQVASASVEISTGSQTLSQSASEQASSLEEISSSLQEMSSMTRQNAANAREATSLAESARHAAERGMESMTRMSEAMNRIKASSDQTARIVKTIDEIAFQTNLLALNAAVEAARAGDAGKGFAVVAEEVRNLAMRSAEAAKNTANLIEESVNNADDGVAINAEVLQHLQEINTQAHKVSEVMAEIAAASEQQTMGIDQVNGAVSQMDQLTQQNAANSEESASAAEELSSQAEEMRSMVAGFALSRSTGARPAHANVRPAARLHHSGNGKGKPMAARPKPSAVIPLDDDEDAQVLQSF